MDAAVIVREVAMVVEDMAVGIVVSHGIETLEMHHHAAAREVVLGMEAALIGGIDMRLEIGGHHLVMREGLIVVTRIRIHQEVAEAMEEAAMLVVLADAKCIRRGYGKAFCMGVHGGL